MTERATRIMRRQIMLTRLVLAVAAIVVLASPARAQTGPAGHWEGTCTVENHELTLSLDLARNPKAEWVASMGIPSANATGLVVQDVVVNGDSVKFVAVELMMATFDLTLGADGRMKGGFSNPQLTVPIEFRRTGDAKVETIAPSPAVSKELEGDWEGSLNLGGNQPFRMVVHLRNQPDGTVAATLDSLDRNAMGVPLNDVKQAGAKVAFGVRVAHSRFEGTLNKEGTELAGQWTHEQGGVPFTLRKR
jgi:hypothetical protein